MKKKIVATIAIAAVFAVGSAVAGNHSKHCNKQHFGSKHNNHGSGMLSRMDTDGDGVITLEEAKRKREKRFTEVDSDGDGTLNLEEFKAMKEKKKAARLKKKLLKWDKNKDGTVTKDEFINQIRIFEKFDINHDKVITQNEAAHHRSHGWQHTNANRHRRMNPNQSGWGGPVYAPWSGNNPWARTYYSPPHGNGPWNRGMPNGWSNRGWGYGPNYR